MDELWTKYGNWALITGASSGIGKCFAQTLAQLGFNLILVARNKEKLDHLTSELSDKYDIQSRTIAAELSEEKSVGFVISQTREIEVNLFINNAGYALTGEFLTSRVEEQTALMKINSLIPMQLSHHFGQQMIARGKGGIINIASVSGMMPLPFWTTYSASKAFLKSFSEALWYELTPYGVDVLAVCPGATKTNFHVTADIQSSGLLPQQVVNGVLKTLGKKPSLIVGASNQFIAIMMSLLPLKLKIKLGASAIDKMKSS